MAAPGLSCSIWDLQSSSRYVGYFSCSMQDLVAWPRIESRPLALGTWSPGHWTTRDVLSLTFLYQRSKNYSQWTKSVLQPVFCVAYELNGLYTFKGFSGIKKRKGGTCSRDCVCPTTPNIFTIQPFTESWPAHSLGQSTANRVYTDCGVKRWALCERQGFTQCMEGVVENWCSCV